MSRAQLFAVLRLNQIYNLGEVERLYMEASGIFSIFKAEHSLPGLSLLPPDDDDVHLMQRPPDASLKSCTSCGNTVRLQAAGEPCALCGNTQWDVAVI